MATSLREFTKLSAQNRYRLEIDVKLEFNLLPEEFSLDKDSDSTTQRKYLKLVLAKSLEESIDIVTEKLGKQDSQVCLNKFTTASKSQIREALYKAVREDAPFISLYPLTTLKQE